MTNDLYDYESTLDYAARRDDPDVDARLAAADLPSDPAAPTISTTPLGERLLRARLAEMRLRGIEVRTPNFATGGDRL